MLDTLGWFVSNLGQAFVNLIWALTHPGAWLGWLGGLETLEDKQALMRFVYYGASVELFFVVLVVFAALTALGLWRNAIMWAMVRGLEALANGVGRVFAWAGLLMVVQQIMIVFLQRIFRVADISIGPFSPFGYKLWDGVTLASFDLSWWSEELKLYNALIVCLCVTYTFVQGGHVRVDLVYSAVRHRTRRLIDMFGALFFMLPVAVLTWLYAWFFMWRHLITPKVSATDKADLLLRKAQLLKWNVETIGFSPNGFNAYFLFKLLLVAFTALVFLQGIAFFYRSYLEWKEGEASIGKHLDRDRLGDDPAEGSAEIHEKGQGR